MNISDKCNIVLVSLQILREMNGIATVKELSSDAMDSIHQAMTTIKKVQKEWLSAVEQPTIFEGGKDVSNSTNN